MNPLAYTYDPHRTGRRIRRLREKADLTRAQLAERSRIGYTTLCHLENGRTGGNINTVACIAHALGVQPGVLLDDLKFVGVEP